MWTLNLGHSDFPINLLHHDQCTEKLHTLASTQEIELDSMRDAAAEPLITNDRDSATATRNGDQDVEPEHNESTLVSPGLFIWGLTVCAGISGLLFGYEYVRKHTLSTGNLNPKRDILHRTALCRIHPNR